MTRLRSSMVLLGICVAAVLLGGLRLLTEQTPQPPGSSFSAEPDGALALYTWLGELGSPTQRLTQTAVDLDVGTVIVLQPVAVLDESTRQSLDSFADRGGRLVVAGDSVPWVVLSRVLGVNVQPIAPTEAPVSTPDGLNFNLGARYRLRADGAEPLLTNRNGDWLALRKPYRQGTLIVVASPTPFTNAGLADNPTAGFVFREVVAPSAGHAVAFDEIGRPGASQPSGQPASLEQLLAQTAPGQALLYVAALTFMFLLLAGRRLGPPLAVASAAESQRTMFEHVQMLADLYRRSGQLDVARSVLSRHYARLLARSGRQPEASAAALRQVESARSEAELVAAVAAIDDLTTTSALRSG